MILSWEEVSLGGVLCSCRHTREATDRVLPPYECTITISTGGFRSLVRELARAHWRVHGTTNPLDQELSLDLPDGYKPVLLEWEKGRAVANYFEFEKPEAPEEPEAPKEEAPPVE